MKTYFKRPLAALIAFASCLCSIQVAAQSAGVLHLSPLSYADLTAEQQHYYTAFTNDSSVYNAIQLVTIDNLVGASEVSGLITISIPGGPQNVQFKVGQYYRKANGDYFWYGHQVLPVGGVENFVAITFKEGVFAGILDFGEDSYEISSIGLNQMVVLQLDPAAGANLMACLQNVDPDGQPSPPSGVMSACVNLKQKILVLFDDDIDFWHPISAIRGKAQNCIDLCNAARSNSLANTQPVELAGVEKFSYARIGGNDIDDELIDFQQQFADPVSTISIKRLQAEADLVVLLFKSAYTDITGGEVAGRACNYPIAADKPFALVQYKYASNTRKLVFMHEVHHLYDCRHPGDNTGQPYAHAASLNGCGSCVCAHSDGTLMFSSGAACDHRHLLLSTPNVVRSTHNMVQQAGDLLTADNRRRVEETEQTIASYFQDNPPASMSVSLGISPMQSCQTNFTATSLVTCGTPPYSYSWYYSAATGGTSIPFAFQHTSATTVQASHTISQVQQYASGFVDLIVQDANGSFAHTSRSVHNFCQEPELWTNNTMPTRGLASNAPVNNMPTLHPIPAREAINITFPAGLLANFSDAGRYQCRIVTTTGITVQQNSGTVDAQTRKAVVPCGSTITAGHYLLLLYFNETRYAIPFTVVD
jgi:hypothetical protein